MGEPPRGRAAGTEKGECGNRTPPKSRLIRFGEISLTHIVIGGKKEKQNRRVTKGLYEEMI